MRRARFVLLSIISCLTSIGIGSGLAQAQGGILAWGDQVIVKQSDLERVAGIDAGWGTSMALRLDGVIVAWGGNGSGLCNVPEPNADFIAIDGKWHCLGLKSDGSIISWGWNGYGQCDVPDPNADFVAVAVGAHHSVALKSDGRIVAWGSNEYGQCDIPEPDAHYFAIAGGGWHGAAVAMLAPTAIQITDAAAEVRDRDVRLRWSTTLDLSAVSFHVYRSGGEPDGSPPSGGDSQFGERLTVNPLTSREGTYEFVDATVRSNRDYEYRVEMLGGGSAPEVVRTFPVHVGRLRWSFGISAVRPHPLSGPATITLEIPEQGQVSLDLMDVGGRRIRQLLDAEMNEGVHEVTFDPRPAGTGGRPLPAGVYYAVLHFNGRAEGKRILVVP